ncbi:MAG: hypothetical protein E6K16_00695, partial [Methanobacteriota archaeon]
MASSTAFEKLETRRTLAKTKRFGAGQAVDKPHHMVLLPKGAKPVSVALSPWQEFAWRTFGGFVQAHYKENQDLEDNLL